MDVVQIESSQLQLKAIQAQLAGFTLKVSLVKVIEISFKLIE